MTNTYVDATNDPSGPGYIHFWIVDLDFASVGGRQVDRTDSAGNVISSAYSNTAGVVSFDVASSNPVHSYYFVVHGPGGSSRVVSSPAGANRIIRIVQVAR
jgi:hypothetical protein